MVKAPTKKKLVKPAPVAKAKPMKPKPKPAKAKPVKTKPAKARAATQAPAAPGPRPPVAQASAPGPQAMSSAVLDRLFAVITGRRTADPARSHSARLLSRGTAKVAQKFGEEAVECVIEGVLGDKDALVLESADVLYHLIVMWVSAGIQPEQVWAEVDAARGDQRHRREGGAARRNDEDSLSETA